MAFAFLCWVVALPGRKCPSMYQLSAIKYMVDFDPFVYTLNPVMRQKHCINYTIFSTQLAETLQK